MTTTIGVFDSGFGGLTVLRALIDRLPQAQFVFLGDTARLPYGSKSRRTIARYAAESAQFLVREQGAEFLVIACNTASALALEPIKAAVQDAVRDAVRDAVSVPALAIPVLGVIEPGAAAARAASQTGDVLVIATDATVQSHAYAAACRAHGLRALEKACPLLVPLVEEGWTNPALASGAVTREVIRIYLAELTAEAAAQGLNPDVLVLGCTHYPLLRPLFEAAVPPGVRIIDSAQAAADAAAHLINDRVLVGRLGVGSLGVGGLGVPGEQLPEVSSNPQLRCFATDSVDKFERLGSGFLGRPVGKVQLVDLGG
jgi:glutamate racemase